MRRATALGIVLLVAASRQSEGQGTPRPDGPRRVRILPGERARARLPSAQQEIRDWIQQLESRSAGERREAARALAGFGPRARDAVPRLVELLIDADGWVADAAKETLSEIGGPALDELVAVLERDSLRLLAADLLLTFGKSGEDALEHFLESGPGAGPRLEVLSILGSRGFERILGMVEEHPAAAIRALRRCRTRGRLFNIHTSAWAQIKEAMVDEDLRRACNMVLYARPEKPDPELLQRISAWLQGDSPVLRETGAWLIGIAAAEVFSVIPQLEAMLTDEDPILRKTAAWAIGRVLTSGRVSPPDLVVCDYVGGGPPMIIPGVGTDYWGPTLGGEPIPPYMRGFDTWAFMAEWADGFAALGDIYFKPRRGRSDKRYAAVVPDLTKLLTDPDSGVVRAAAWSLGGAGPDAAPAASRLAMLLDSDDRRIRWEAAVALADLGPRAAHVKDAVIRSLWDGGGPPEVYYLASLGEASLIDLVDVLEHPHPVAVEFAIMALAGMDRGPVDCSQRLASAYRRNQYLAAGLLVQSGEYGETVLAEVLAGDYSRDLRGVSAYALRYTGPVTQTTLDALRRVRDDTGESATLRGVVAETLESLKK